ncbi:uncharacterized protein LY89DRAFT_783655 [Mollisia scopiformis]|uniref:Uncharacterized protein n=1 Tax=Mollisia scopiformis TaxID=149040 RepID=A0A194X5R3_MOLSC|nr:uncharacterized protein LY89DRAFT_783655 [Mollisia scopiformis]KUJ15525.1 hypothetical protein LY89DRAFT_783655 [Mollisia scopiformis]
MARSAASSFTLAVLPFLFLAMFVTSAVATTASVGLTTASAVPSPTANGTYTKPAPTNSGSVAATSSIVGAAAIPDAQYSAFFALTVAIFGSFALGLGL